MRSARGCNSFIGGFRFRRDHELLAPFWRAAGGRPRFVGRHFGGTPVSLLPHKLGGICRTGPYSFTGFMGRCHIILYSPSAPSAQKWLLDYPAVGGGVAPTVYSLYSALGFASVCLLSALSWLCFGAVPWAPIPVSFLWRPCPAHRVARPVAPL